MKGLRPLESAAFRHLAAAYWINEFGSWIGEIALAILVYDRTHSALGTAALFVAMRCAPALLAPLLTTRLETGQPRLVLGGLYALEAGLFVGLALSGRDISPAVAFVVVAADGVLAITARALSRSATATELTKSGNLREGNGILNLGVLASTAGAPALAGLVVAWQGTSGALMIDAGTFLAAAVTVASARGLRIESDHDAHFLDRLNAGKSVVLGRATVRRLVFAVALGLMFCSIATPVDVVFAKRTLAAGDLGYGLILTAWGVAMVAGGIAFTRAGGLRLMTLLGGSTVLLACAYFGLAVAPSLAVACAFAALGGAGNGVAWIAAVTALQEQIPATTQAAVMSMFEALAQLVPGVGFGIGGALTALESPRFAYAVTGASVALLLLVFTLRPVHGVRLVPVEDADRSRTTAPAAAPPKETPADGRMDHTTDMMAAG